MTKKQTKEFYTFTPEEMEKHDNHVREAAYHKAAKCTIRNVSKFSGKFNSKSINHALRFLQRYELYLRKVYKLEKL